jgi:hypothetical protein
MAGRGHRRVVAAFYDAPLDRTREWVKSAAKGKGVTTWVRDFSQIEAFARCVKTCERRR